jgi:hypothetical protein
MRPVLSAVRRRPVAIEMKRTIYPALILSVAATLSCMEQSPEPLAHAQGAGTAFASLAPVTVEAQPLAANIQRLV